MNTEKLIELVRNHYFAASIAIVIVAGCVVVLIPEDIHHLDLSATDNKAAVVTVEGRLLSFFSWEYTTNIDKVNGLHSFDKLYGLPDLVIMDEGIHELNVSCSWRFLNNTWVRSEHEIKLDALPSKVYQLQSRRTPKRVLWGDCSVYAEEIRISNRGLLTEMQKKYLEQYDFEQLAY